MVKGYLAFSASVALLGLSVAAHSATAVSSSLYVYALADIGAYGGEVTDDDYFTQLGTTSSFSGSAFAMDSDQTGYVKTSSIASATWASANSGHVQFDRVGWDINATSGFHSACNYSGTGIPLWTYTFTASGDGIFEMSYDVYGLGDKFGLWGAAINFSGPGGGVDNTDANDPDDSGYFSRAIAAGQNYTVTIYNWSNIFSSGPGTIDGHVYGKFDWNIRDDGAAVPGPAAALPFIGGLLMAARRKRKS